MRTMLSLIFFFSVIHGFAQTLNVPGGDINMTESANIPHTIRLQRNGMYVGAVSTYNARLSIGAFSRYDAMIMNSSEVGLIVKDSTGNIGIGTTSPRVRLDVLGDFYFMNRPPLMGDNGNTLGGDINFTPSVLKDSNNSYVKFVYPNNSTFKIASNFDGHLANGVYPDIAFGRWNSANYMTIKDGGNIGIGVDTPRQKLSVNGNISAKKLIITQTGWSDYVFDEDYNLRSLGSLEDYIKQNKHLPDMPTAKEVEEKGISVGDNQGLLLKKIEELTLYMIQQQNQINKQAKEIQSLKNKSRKK